ncbi:DNA modification methylase [Dielma fastidiosa]|uniref:DNA modification methylase n=1 Tax=Dielma fastidiosa TaxID=1034346 RepID=UPI0023F214CB|nr:DNA modification methylase [Dielma fastidiosa]
MNIKNVKISDLKMYENNPRKNDDAVEKVAESIKLFGFKVPIVIDINNIIVAGHTRYKACLKLGIEEIPAVIADDLTDDQLRAFRIADNKTAEYATWDLEKLDIELKAIEMDLSCFDFEILDDLYNAENDDFDFDAAVEEIKEPITKPGDIWLLGMHRLMCGDSTSAEDVGLLMDNVIADLVMTDPPYNVNVSNSQGKKIENDNLSDIEFHDFLKKAFYNLSENLKPGGAFYVWFASKEYTNFEKALNENGLSIRQELIWNKNQFVLSRQDYHWKHEPCLYGWKDGAAHYFMEDRTQSTLLDDINDLDAEQLREVLKELTNQMQTTVISEAKPSISEQHPTMKPVKLLGRLIKNSCQMNENVMDLFGGSGSTLIACEQLHRNCYMMELDPVYCDVIISRWETLTGHKAVLDVK